MNDMNYVNYGYDVDYLYDLNCVNIFMKFLLIELNRKFKEIIYKRKIYFTNKYKQFFFIFNILDLNLILNSLN